VLPFPGAPLLFAVHPVTRSDGQGPAGGWFLIGRFLDAGRLAELAADVGLELAYAPPEALAPGATEAVRLLDGARLLVQGAIADPAGATAFVVEIRESREISRRGMATIRTFLFLAIGVGAVVGASSLLLLHRGVIARIESLDEQVRRVSGSARGAPAVAIAGADEISALAGSINEMLHSLATADETLLRSERLAAVGTLAGGVAHQFNNLHTGLLAYADLVAGRPGLDETARGYLQQIVKGVQRAGMITRGLLAFSGEVQQALIPCRLDEVVAEALPLVARDLARYNIVLESRLGEVPAIPMDPALIQQVVLNLLLNAIHALIGRPERRIVVETGLAGPHVRLEVRDTGCGIAAADQPRLFTPFFTAKGEHAPRGSAQEQVTGTGLGLSVSHAIVARHSGRIEVQSREGVGSVFTVLLPLAAAPAPTP
jgi:signal transduction histidine kinase